MLFALLHARQRYAALNQRIGKYRDKFTNLVNFRYRTVATTNIVWFRGKLLALKDDGIPWAMNPDTLEKFGIYDFDGQLDSVTFTAHPKFDTKRLELLSFGNEAKGDATRDVNYISVDKNGRFNEHVWFLAQVCGMQHDFATTDNYVSVAT
jgi:carotenoid cleavage dioxygenase-like enzyme